MLKRPFSIYLHQKNKHLGLNEHKNKHSRPHNKKGDGYSTGKTGEPDKQWPSDQAYFVATITESIVYNH